LLLMKYILTVVLKLYKTIIKNNYIKSKVIMKITHKRLKRIIREELLREASGAAGPGTVPGYNYIEVSEYRGKPAHMINAKHLKRTLKETLGIKQHGTADDHFHQAGLGGIISGWGSLSKKLTKIWSDRIPQGQGGHGTGCQSCWADFFILVDLGKCGASQAYLIPGVSVVEDIPIIVFGDISLEPLIDHIADEAGLAIIGKGEKRDDAEQQTVENEWAEWTGRQYELISKFHNKVYYGGEMLSDLLHDAFVFRTPVIVVLPRSSLIKDIDPCVIAKNYQLLRAPPVTPVAPAVKDEVELDPASVEIDPQGQQIDIDSEIYDAPLEPYKSPFRTPIGKQD